METFDFPYHRLSLKHPENTGSVKLGNGYTFVGRPVLPSQHLYVLNFPAMWWIVDESGVPDLTVDVQRNVGVLNTFYEQHQMYEKFLFQSYIHGEVVVRFSRPLELPEPLENQHGRLPPFTVELMRQP